MKSCGFCFFSTVSNNFTSSCMQTVIHQMLLLQVFQHFSNTNLFVGDVFLKDQTDMKKTTTWYCPFFKFMHLPAVHTQTSRPELQLYSVHVTPLGFVSLGKCPRLDCVTFHVDASSAVRRLCVSLWTSCIFVVKGGENVWQRKMFYNLNTVSVVKIILVWFTAAQFNVKHWILLEATRQFRNYKKLPLFH